MKKFRYLFILAVIALDQLVKYVVKTGMEVGQSIDVVGRIFSITYVQNRGAAFGIMDGKRMLLIGVPILACVLAVIVMEKFAKKEHWTLTAAISLVVAGGLGNLIDRAFLGYVTDMFDFHFWPVFNVADIAVCVGCGLAILYVFKFDKKK